MQALHRGTNILEMRKTLPLRTLPTLVQISLLISLVSGRIPVAAAEAPLERFPVVLYAGSSNSVEEIVGSANLPDQRFRRGNNYGHVGGEPVLLAGARVIGGPEAWPLVWRENLKRYVFQVPNGTYVLGMTFIETRVAAEGLRVFDVLVQGQSWLPRFDIFREAGDFRWLTIRQRVEVRDGWLDIGFRAHPDKLPPLVARIEIRRPEDIAVEPATPSLTVHGSYRGNRLNWNASVIDTLGYGVYRSDAPDGPFQAVTEYPVHVNEFVDRRVVPGSSYFYRVQAYGVKGGQSSLSSPRSAVSHASFDGDLRVVDVRVPEEAFVELFDREHGVHPVEGEVFFYGKTRGLKFNLLTRDPLWQYRKSFRLEFDRRRGISGFRNLLLLAEAGDPTRLRQKLFFDLQDTLGLGAPRSEYVRLLLNGQYRGLFLERERLGKQYRDRIRVDSVGDFAALEDDGLLRFDWRPYGKPADGGGSLWNLSLFVQEMNLLNEGEIDDYFERYFYVDRLFGKMALTALVGLERGEVASRHYLGDSRNLRWEVYPSGVPEGAFGQRLFEVPASSEPHPGDVRWSLFGPSLRGRRLPVDRWHILEARLFNRPEIWKAYLERVEKMAREEITPEVFEKIVAANFAKIEKAYADEPRVWPEDGGEAFRSGPQAIGDYFKAHREKLLELIEAERERSPAPLVINELLLRPKAEGIALRDSSLDGAWIEVLNRSSESVALGRYRLSVDPRSSALWPLPDRQLGPGEHLVIQFHGEDSDLRCNLRPSPTGGVILLARVDEVGAPRVSDAVFYGYQSGGIAYARAGNDWAHAPRPSPGKTNPPERLDAPGWKYQWKLDRQKNGDHTIWVRVPDAEEVALYIKRPGRSSFESVALQADEKGYGHSVSVTRFEQDPQMPFFFLARSALGVERPYPLTGPDLTLFIPDRPTLVINEVLPRPLRGNSHGEFIEIYNAGNSSVSIEGMFLTDKRRNPLKWRVPLSGMLAPKGFKVVYADGLGRGNHAPFKLSNAGEYLGLYHPREAGSVLIDHIAYTAVPANQSWGRERDGKKGGRVWKDPTPGRKNLPKIPEEYLRDKKDKKKDEGAAKANER